MTEKARADEADGVERVEDRGCESRGDCATGEKESIGIPLYGYANDGRKGREERRKK